MDLGVKHISLIDRVYDNNYHNWFVHDSPHQLDQLGQHFDLPLMLQLILQPVQEYYHIRVIYG